MPVITRCGSAAIQGLIILSPLLLHVFLNVPVYALNDFQDAVFYHGILLDLPGHLQRFGPQYYNVRFGAIFPELPFWRLFGPEAGYITYRWALTAGCGLLLFRCVSRRTGRPAGILAAGLYLLSPITARMTIETYVDLSTVSFALC